MQLPTLEKLATIDHHCERDQSEASIQGAGTSDSLPLSQVHLDVEWELFDGRKAGFLVPGSNLTDEQVWSLEDILSHFTLAIQTRMGVRAFQVLPHAVVILNREGRVADINSKFREVVLLGPEQSYPRDEPFEKTKPEFFKNAISFSEEPRQLCLVDSSQFNPSNTICVPALVTYETQGPDHFYYIDDRSEVLTASISQLLSQEVDRSTPYSYSSSVCRILQKYLNLLGVIIPYRVTEKGWALAYQPYASDAVTQYVIDFGVSARNIDRGMWEWSFGVSDTDFYESDVAKNPNHERCFRAEASEYFVKLGDTISAQGEQNLPIGILDVTSNKVDGLSENVRKVVKNLSIIIGKELGSLLQQRTNALEFPEISESGGIVAFLDKLAGFYRGSSASHVRACFYTFSPDDASLVPEFFSTSYNKIQVQQIVAAHQSGLFKVPIDDTDVSTSLVVMAYRTKEAHIIPDTKQVSNYTKIYNNLSEGMSVMAHPVSFGGHIQGVVYVESSTVHDFNMFDLVLLSHLSSLGISAVKRFDERRLYESMVEIIRRIGAPSLRFHDVRSLGQKLVGASCPACQEIVAEIDRLDHRVRACKAGHVPLAEHFRLVCSRQIEEATVPISCKCVVREDWRQNFVFVWILEEILRNATTVLSNRCEAGFEPKIEVTPILSVKEEQVGFRVSNNGAPLNTNDPFSIQPESVDSMGYAMAVCRAIVSAYGGDMYARDLPEGSHMTVEFVVNLSTERPGSEA